MDSVNKSRNLRSMEASFMESTCTMVISKLPLEFQHDKLQATVLTIYLNLALQGQHIVYYLIQLKDLSCNLLITKTKQSIAKILAMLSPPLFLRKEEKQREHRGTWALYLVTARDNTLQKLHPLVYFLPSHLMPIQVLWHTHTHTRTRTAQNSKLLCLAFWAPTTCELWMLSEFDAQDRRVMLRITLSARLWLSVAWPLLALT